MAKKIEWCQVLAVYEKGFRSLVLCLSVAYELALMLLLFQTADDARQLLKYLDESLGEPLPEMSGHGTCLLWDPDYPGGPVHKLLAECDIFAASHVVGFYALALAARDSWLCHVISVTFELLEYTLEHQMHDFFECWWDHWILDAVLSNGLGIWCGMKTLELLEIKLYDWRGLWKSSGGHLTSCSRTESDGSPMWRLKQWLSVMGVITVILLWQLNIFYLKHVLWVPTPHWLNHTRLTLGFLMASVACGQAYRYLSEPNCRRLGLQTWLLFLTVITEVLIIVRFDLDLLLLPFPDHIVRCWIAGSVVLTSWAVWRFYVR